MRNTHRSADGADQPIVVPQYWTLPFLFNLDEKIRVGIEDFRWAAAVGGLAVIVGEILLKEQLKALRKTRHKTTQCSVS